MSNGNGEAVMSPAEIGEALETIKAIELMGYFLEESQPKLRFAKAIFHCMDLLRDMHDRLVAELPPEVIAAERAKSFPPAQQENKQQLKTTTTPLGVA